MLVTQKNQYALRAIFELAKLRGKGPIKISDIAESQAIPYRFLEVILNQLKHGGLVKSKRGYTGGYELIREPEKVSVGDVFRAMEESVGPIECVACTSKNVCPFEGNCVFFPMWKKVEDAIYHVFDKTSIKDLLEDESMDDNMNTNCCT